MKGFSVLFFLFSGAAFSYESLGCSQVVQSILGRAILIAEAEGQSLEFFASIEMISPGTYQAKSHQGQIVFSLVESTVGETQSCQVSVVDGMIGELKEVDLAVERFVFEESGPTPGRLIIQKH